MSARRTAAALGGVWLALVSACAAAEPVQPASDPSVATGTGGTNDSSVLSRPYVVLVSFDGFRADYLDRFDTPSFDRLSARGVRASGLVSVFPSLTFPGHYSIATGLYPEAHGIVGNRFYDPVREEEFDYRDREDAQDGSWWGGEPIWVTAEQQGMVSAAFFFPGTEADIGGVHPSHWRPYEGSVPNVERIEQVLAWLEMPARERPHFITLYFSLVDSAGHRLGPAHEDLGETIEAADRLLGQLMSGLDALPHAERIDLVVVSDHGMAAVDPPGGRRSIDERARRQPRPCRRAARRVEHASDTCSCVPARGAAGRFARPRQSAHGRRRRDSERDGLRRVQFLRGAPARDVPSGSARVGPAPAGSRRESHFDWSKPSMSTR